MYSSGLGDLAHNFAARNRNSTLKQDIARLTQEFSTGQATDVRQLLVGNYSFLTDVERKTEVLEGFSVATKEATQFTGAMQLALEDFYRHTEQLSDALVGGGTSSNGATAQDLADEASNAMLGMFGILNSSSAGRQLFAGNMTNQRPLVDVATVMSDLTAAISGATTPADMLAQATVWFDDPAGFLASAYQGSTAAMSGFAVSQQETVELDLRASDPLFVPALRAAAVSALATDPTFGLTPAQQTELFALTAQDMLEGQGATISAQARVGFAQARLDTIATRNAAEVTSLNMAKNALLEVDPFEAASKLEEAQFQLQSLYSVTVRMSQLSLVNFL